MDWGGPVAKLANIQREMFRKQRDKHANKYYETYCFWLLPHHRKIFFFPLFTRYVNSIRCTARE